ncbi:MAG: hypothetical protein ACKO37_04375 [Vampirovibrionales bacterium]
MSFSTFVRTLISLLKTHGFYRVSRASLFVLVMIGVLGCGVSGIHPQTLAVSETQASPSSSSPSFATAWFQHTTHLREALQGKSWSIRFDGMVEREDGILYVPVLPVIPSVADRKHPERALERFSFGEVMDSVPSSEGIIAFQSGAYLLQLIPTSSGKWTLPRAARYPEALKAGLVWPDVILPENLSIPVELQTLFAPLLSPFNDTPDSTESPSSTSFSANIAKQGEFKECVVFGHGLSPATSVMYRLSCHAQSVTTSAFTAPEVLFQQAFSGGMPLLGFSHPYTTGNLTRFELLTHPTRLSKVTLSPQDGTATSNQQQETLLAFLPQGMSWISHPSMNVEKQTQGWLMIPHPTEHYAVLYHPESLRNEGRIDFPETAHPSHTILQHGAWLWIADAEKAVVYEYHYSQKSSVTQELSAWQLTRLLPGVTRASHLQLVRHAEHPYPYLAMSAKSHGLLRWVYLPTGKSAGETLVQAGGQQVKQAWVQNDTLHVLVETPASLAHAPEYSIQACGMVVAPATRQSSETLPNTPSKPKARPWWKRAVSQIPTPVEDTYLPRSSWQCQVQTGITLPSRPLLWSQLSPSHPLNQAQSPQGLWLGFSTRGVTTTDQTQLMYLPFKYLGNHTSEGQSAQETALQEWFIPELLLMPSFLGTPSK